MIGSPFTLVPAPVQFDVQGTSLQRAPLLGEHSDEVLRELGKTEAQIQSLKTAKIVV